MYIYSHFGISVYLELQDKRKILVKGKNSSENFLLVGKNVPILSEVDINDEDVKFLKEKYKKVDLFKKGLIYFSENLSDAKAEMKNLFSEDVLLSPQTNETLTKKRDTKIKTPGQLVDSKVLTEQDLI